MNKIDIFLNKIANEEKFKTIQKGFLIYGIIGLALYLYFYKNHFATTGYFIFGWAFSYINFELQKRGFKYLFAFLGAAEVSRAPSAIYMILFLKLTFLGIVIAFLVFSNNVLLAPFLVGMASLLFAVLGLAFRMLTTKSVTRSFETQF